MASRSAPLDSIALLAMTWSLVVVFRTRTSSSERAANQGEIIASVVDLGEVFLFVITPEMFSCIYIIPQSLNHSTYPMPQVFSVCSTR